MLVIHKIFFCKCNKIKDHMAWAAALCFFVFLHIFTSFNPLIQDIQNDPLSTYGFLSDEFSCCLIVGSNQTSPDAAISPERSRANHRLYSLLSSCCYFCAFIVVSTCKVKPLTPSTADVPWKSNPMCIKTQSARGSGCFALVKEGFVLIKVL